MNEALINLLHRVDGQLGLAVYRGEHDERWQKEAAALITEIRATLAAGKQEPSVSDFSVSVEYYLVGPGENDTAWVPGFSSLEEAQRVALALVPSDGPYRVTRRLVTQDTYALVWDEEHGVWMVNA